MVAPVYILNGGNLLQHSGSNRGQLYFFLRKEGGP